MAPESRVGTRSGVKSPSLVRVCRRDRQEYRQIR
jgi:hypothetical protein